MRIKALAYHRFRRLTLANIETIEINTESDYQLWMGTNGSGKTSMLQTANPLPKETKDFDKDGWFSITLEDRGVEYVCKSVRHGNSMRHHFEVDGVNQNPGFTAAVQKELCRRYFGLTPELMSIINNTERFTAMSVNARRQFFTKLSPVDLTYAQGLFQELKKKHRSAVGALEWVERRIDQESRKLLSPEQVKEHQATAERLHAELELCLQSRPQASGQSLAELEREFEAAVRRTERRADQVSGHDPAYTIPWASTDAIRIAGFQAQAELQAIEEQYRALAAEAERDQTITTAIQGVTENRGALLERLAALREEVKQFPAEIREFPGENIKAQLEDFGCCKSPLLDTLSTLPDPTIENFSRDRQQQVRYRLDELRQELSRIETNLEQGQRRLQHIDHSKTETCPACEHQFQPGIPATERPQLIEYLTEQADLLAHRTGERDGLQEYWVLAQQFEEGLSQLRQMLVAFPRLGSLWQQLTLRDNNPRALIPVIANYERTLEQVFALRNVELEITRAEETLRLLDAQESEEVKSARARLERTEVRLLELAQERTACQQREREARTCLDYCLRWEENHTHMWLEQATAAGVWERYLEELRRTELNGLIQEHQTQLSQINSVQREQEIVAGVLAELTQQKVELTEQVAAYAVLIEELSPNDGLIAEQLSGFIAEFTSKMNALLGKIWTYPMMILPCGIDQGELTYRFPVVFPDEEDYRTADVAETSSAQSDILDFVFKLTLLIYLQIENLPLYIDELGRSFDPVHRQRVLQFVTDYVEMGKAPQVFWISHYLSNSTAWPNAEVCVVHSGNVEISRVYNQHVRIR